MTWMHCIGPVRGEHGIFCRWGVDHNEVPDCVACQKAALQAEADGVDFYVDREIDMMLEDEHDR